MIKNAIHANRGFLEFYFDQRADNPFKKIDVKSDSKIIIYCGAGGQGLGYKNAYGHGLY